MAIQHYHRTWTRTVHGSFATQGVNNFTHFHTTSIDSFPQHSILPTLLPCTVFCCTPLFSVPLHLSPVQSSPLHSLSYYSFSFHFVAFHAASLSSLSIPHFSFPFLSTKLYNILSTMFRCWRCKLNNYSPYPDIQIFPRHHLIAVASPQLTAQLSTPNHHRPGDKENN